MKKILLLICIVSFTISFQANAQSCKQGTKLAKATWRAWGTPTKADTKEAAYKNQLTVLKENWGKIATNAGAAIGPGFLKTNGNKEQGAIAPQAKKTLVSAPAHKDNMTIAIKSYSGKTDAGLIICGHDKKGEAKVLFEYTFPKENVEGIKKFDLTNVKGKIITVSMRNTSVANTFKYQIGVK